MKRLAAALAIAATGLMAGGVAHAYPPDSGTVTPSDSTPEPGASFDADVDSCTPSETVSFEFQGQTDTDICSSEGTAVASFAAPTEPGSYDGTATFSDTTITFTIVVEDPTGGLPATGSSGSGTTIFIATMLLLVGAGMFGVAQIRRRQTLTA